MRHTTSKFAKRAGIHPSMVKHSRVKISNTYRKQFYDDVDKLNFLTFPENVGFSEFMESSRLVLGENRDSPGRPVRAAELVRRGHDGHSSSSPLTMLILYPHR
ncbi:hypothetical protein DFH94DRAFT_687354 [Russula ochroleuca]|uniref:Uncharacterized protein n=1 Tax=Russula ochroleuca TaxID=152965 RepID=A0A9P5N5I3_9AGAM|nr:hypothetical protein DFH94DRAFT_687354 [Russula ochroleuca]